MLDGFHFKQKANADFSWSQKFGADFTGSTFKMEIRNSAGLVQATLTSPASGIAPTFGAQTTLDFFLARASLPAVGNYAYDVLRITDNGAEPDFEDYLMGGDFIVVAGITEA